LQSYSKKNFAILLQALGKDEDWEERMKAMATLQQLSQTSDEKLHATFVSGFDAALQKSLIAQVPPLARICFPEDRCPLPPSHFSWPCRPHDSYSRFIFQF